MVTQHSTELPASLNGTTSRHHVGILNRVHRCISIAPPSLVRAPWVVRCQAIPDESLSTYKHQAATHPPLSFCSSVVAVRSRTMRSSRARSGAVQAWEKLTCTFAQSQDDRNQWQAFPCPAQTSWQCGPSLACRARSSRSGWIRFSSARSSLAQNPSPILVRR